MDKTKHTPGPWQVSYETDISGFENDPENGCIGLVDVAHVYMRTVPGRHEANARLIAAAPELLEALAAVVCQYGNPDIHKWMAVINQASAAITKATGGNNAP